MTIPIFQIDAFAQQPFQGNPACVCLMPGPAADPWMQSVAAEMNLSETAFVWRNGERFRLRWFTPLTEVRLCGHATMAAAHAIWSYCWLPTEQTAVFETQSGELRVAQVDDRIEMDFPLQPAERAKPPVGLLDSLGVRKAEFVGFNGSDYLVQLDSESAVQHLAPDIRQLALVQARGVIVTAASDSREFDFVSRFFAPSVGVDEDPVTGSAHTVLAPYWAQIIGRGSLSALQLSRRGGIVSTRIEADRVFIGGHCVSVFRGDLLV